ncbi:hypothetical protein [Streptomyces sp. NPDC090083]|uniref:hypothetical protein n=1 Tax=Streptomyces sp. NPDC090083 TaxID=3365941 RepID=UPI00381BC573
MAEIIPPPHPAGVIARRLFVPPPALCGFLMLLVLVFSASYAVGSSAGPVAPGMHGTRGGAGGGAGDDSGDGSGGGMQDMHDMPGTTDGSGR